jgi:hypothetical protein
LLAALVSLAGSAARADELLVMPYSCAMVGGQPLLTRAPEQGHRIVGRREQRAFTACSPANPGMCRNWTVHRFDIDCEGTRVPWVDVVASAAGEYGTGRAWMENGRLLVRMPRTWSFEPDDPCARRPGFGDQLLFGRMRRYCNDRSAMAPPVVEMPMGFAPMLGIDGIFVKESPPAVGNADPAPLAPPTAPPATAPSATAPPAKVARAEAPPPPQPAPPARSDAPSNPTPPKEAPAKEAPAKAATAKAEPPRQAAIKPPVQATPPPAQAAKAPPAPSAPPPATSGGPVIPKIINRPDAATGDTTEPPVAAVTAPKQAPPPAPKAQTPTPAPSKDASVPPQAPSAEAAPPARKDGPVSVSLLTYARSPTVGAVAALGGIAIVLLAAFGVARRRERARFTGARPHDFASVSLDGRRGGGGLVARASRGPRQPAPAAQAPQPPAQPAPYGVAPTLIDRIPQTRAEAVQMLGIGVSPDANEAAMKRIVDGLRLSWHPDLAKDETDRQLREFRIKQINAAWDLIRGRRTERLDS